MQQQTTIGGMMFVFSLSIVTLVLEQPQES